jgi:hypothetical protein
VQPRYQGSSRPLVAELSQPFARRGFPFLNRFVTIPSRNGGVFLLILSETIRKNRHFRALRTR